MQVTRKQVSPTNVALQVNADPAFLTTVKEKILTRLGKQMKVPGFRIGKAPIGLIEKRADSSVVQSEFIDEAVNDLYARSVEVERLRPAGQPKVTLEKFVPFTTLEVAFEVEVIGDVTLPDYTSIRLAKKPVSVSTKDVDAVLHNLQTRAAERVEEQRGARSGDEVTIDFTGKDSATNEKVNGAADTAYPLILGSKTFIPGFEENLIGMKPDESKSFEVTFPSDYGLATLRNRKVTFDVRVSKVTSLREPTLDDAFAAKVGPFKSIADLKQDIEKQLINENESQTEQQYQNDLLEKITHASKVAIPDTLIKEEVARIEQQTRQNIVYRGQTWVEYLKDLGQSEEAYRDSQRIPAEQRVKAWIILTEIAEREHIVISPEEFQLRMQLLKGQYKDPAMQAELEKPDNARSVMSRMLSEKTLAKLTDYATAKAPAVKHTKQSKKPATNHKD